MKIAIATGIYPPEIGGHSFYVEGLERALRSQGHTVTLVLYGKLKRLPTGLRHVFYAAKLWWLTRDVDGVISFDTFSVAIPIGWVAKVSKRKIVNRAGGDFVWENYIERTRDFVPLPRFYADRSQWNLKERIAYRLIRSALSRVHVVFSSAWFRDIWTEPYGFDPNYVHVIENANEPSIPSQPYVRKNFLFYTREIAFKNHEAFRVAFDLARTTNPDIVLEEGVLSHDELMAKIETGYAVVLPSISEITPHYILEAIRRGKPFLLTEHCGYADKYRDLAVLVDPLSVEDMARGIRELADDQKYKEYARRVSAFNLVRTYDDIARDFVTLLEKI